MFICGKKLFFNAFARSRPADVKSCRAGNYKMYLRGKTFSLTALFFYAKIGKRRRAGKSGLYRARERCPAPRCASVAQLVEQRIRNA